MLDLDRVRRDGGRAASSVASTSRWLLHRHLTARAAAEEAENDERAFRRQQLRQIAVLVTLPGVLLGTASIAGAYGSGLMSSASASCDPTVVPAPPRASFTISVLNASGLSGKAGEVAKQLTRRGFRVAEASTAPRNLYVQRPVAVYHGKDGLDEALLAAQQVKGAELYDDGRKGTSISFVLGAEYTDLLPAPPPKPPLPREVTVNVYNTTWKVGIGASLATELVARGFVKGEVGNDPQHTFLPDTTVVIRHGEDGELGATLLAQHFPGAQLQPDGRTGKTVDVLIGNRYDRLTPLADVPRPPMRAPEPPAKVVRPCSVDG